MIDHTAIMVGTSANRMSFTSASAWTYLRFVK
jgi:hypothetical protein